MSARIQLPAPYNKDDGVSENEVNAKILEAAEGNLLWRHHPCSPGRRKKTDMVGVSDWIGIAPDGRGIAIEAKKRGGTISIEQLDFLRAVGARGGHAYVICSIGLAFAATCQILQGKAPKGRTKLSENVWII